jgi:hypothetical protein
MEEKRVLGEIGFSVRNERNGEMDGWRWVVAVQRCRSGAMVVGEMMGGGRVWIIGRLDEEG